MPLKFSVKTKNKLLIDVPQGVIYLDNPFEYEKFEEQYGATCVYTALGHIGLHYGQDYFDKSKVGVEEILWDMSTAIGDATLDKRLSQKAKDRKLIKACEKAMEKLELTHEKIWHSNKSFQLSFTDTNEARNFKKKDSLTESEHWLTLDLASRFNILINGIYNSAIYQQTFATKLSAWNPSLGKEGLFQSLSLYGAQVVCGKFGLPYHKKDYQLAEDKKLTAEQDVFEFQPNDYDDTIIGYHGITIIGMSLENKDEETIIYYLDPNLSLKPGSQNIVLSMSYKEFLNNLTDINGLSVDEVDDVRSHNYSWCSDFELQDEITLIAKQHYEKGVQEYYGAEALESEVDSNTLLLAMLMGVVSSLQVEEGMNNEVIHDEIIETKPLQGDIMASAYPQLGFLKNKPLSQENDIQKGNEEVSRNAYY